MGFKPNFELILVFRHGFNIGFKLGFLYVLTSFDIFIRDGSVLN